MRQAILKNAVETFGKEHQLLKTAEELGELSSAICKYLEIILFDNEIPEEDKQKLIDNLHEETADVIDMCDQLKHFILDTMKIEGYQYYKEIRLKETIKKVKETKRKI